jgi:hypothetical protein
VGIRINPLPIILTEGGKMIGIYKITKKENGKSYIG